MIDLSVLNRLLLDALPFHREESILKVHYCLPDSFISEDQVIVHDINDQGRTPREGGFEVVVLVEVGVRVVSFIIIPLIILLLSDLEHQVRVREPSVVSGSKIIGTDHVDSHYTLGFSQQ